LGYFLYLGECNSARQLILIQKAMFMEGHIPKGETCISVFLVLKGKSGILVGKMAKPEIWVERFLVGDMFARKYAASSKWLIPASYLIFGEDPMDAAMRVLAEQIGLKKTKLTFLQVQSHLAQDPNDPETGHWDICFVYGGEISERFEKPVWFSELQFVNPRELESNDFTRGHGDVLKELGILKI
jgi:ADP-ribose pyrophosphatase YjhB (NUDIX family)